MLRLCCARLAVSSLRRSGAPLQEGIDARCGLRRMRHAGRDGDAREVIPGQEQPRPTSRCPIQHREEVAMTDAVLRQPARPMAHAGKYRLALGTEQIGKLLARHFD